MFLVMMVTTVRGQRHRRAVIRSQDGLFYHQGPYLSHLSHRHRQVTRQAPASFHRSPLLQSHLHTSTPVRFPQHNFPANGGQTQALGHNGQRTHQGHRGFIGPVLPPQSRQPLLSPVVSPPTPAPALTFLDNTSRHQPQQLGHQSEQLGHQPQQLGHQPQQLGHQPQQLGHQTLQLSSPQQHALFSSSPNIPNTSPPPASDHKPSSALENLMAIAGDDWDLTAGGSPRPGSEVFQCPALEGHFRSPLDCAVYYQCAQGRPHRRSCHTGLAYNGLTNQCDWAENVKC